jgi:CubicO group peptidase (beta-lactamase class C family)
MYKLFISLILALGILSCSKDETAAPNIPTPVPEAYYYPPLTGSEWTTKTVASLSWDSLKLEEALNYAGARSSYGVIILQNGRIVKEKYWNSWNQGTRYFIASAGKSVVASLVGIAQQDGILNINAPSATYLGTGWTSLTSQQEQLITVKHQLSMTTGLNDNVPDANCTTPACLTYLAAPGTRWAYYNAPYLLLHNVLANASGLTFNQYAKQKLFDKIGMPQSFWFDGVMYCTTREAARFGSLILKKGKWDGVTILQDSNYYASMINSSQTLNNSYGYLWWLNGKSSYMVPTLQAVFPGSLASNAPADMIMALGKDDKKIYVVPSLNLVVVRLGDAAGTPTLGPSSFDNEFWGKLKLAIGY